jgi:hypothetical protein
MFKSGCHALVLILLLLTAVRLGAIDMENPDSIPAAVSDPLADSLVRIITGEPYNRVLDHAILLQKKSDSLLRLSIEWRKEAARMDDPIQRGRLQKRIEIVEDSLEIYRHLADEKFAALNAMLPGASVPEVVHPYLLRDTVLNGITVYNYNLNDEFRAKLAEIRAPAAGVEASGPGTKMQAGSPGYPLSGMQVLKSSPYSTKKPFERNFKIPPGVFYRIQLIVFKNEPAWDYFGGLAPITTEDIPGRELTRYFAGKFTRIEEARKALNRIRQMGYSDAFIVGYYNGKKSSFSRLESLEK